MAEREEARLLANRVLNEPGRDPDDDLSMLSRQLLRADETIGRLKRDLAAGMDPMVDVIAANQDEILRMHAEAARRVRRCLLRDNVALALKVLDALNLFHPMHAESWQGWPEGS